jgi:hypothetical protein
MATVMSDRTASAAVSPSALRSMRTLYLTVFGQIRPPAGPNHEVDGVAAFRRHLVHAAMALGALAARDADRRSLWSG